MKALYVVLTGSKKSIEENEKLIADYLKGFKRKVGNNIVNCATIQKDIPLDREHTSGHRFSLKDFPKIEWYLRGYRAVILKFSNKTGWGMLYTRGRRWRVNKKGKEVYK